MQTEVVTVSPIRREVKVSYTADEVKKAFNKKTKQVAEQVSIKGFRPGKAPLDVISGKYAGEIRQEVLQELLQNGLEGAVREHQVYPVGPIDPLTADEMKALLADAPFNFSLKFEVRPEITLANYKGLKLKRPQVQAGDAEVNNEIDRYRASAGQLVPVMIREELEEKDFAVLDAQAQVGLEPEPSLSLKDELVEITEGRFMAGFTQKLIGLRTNGTASFDLEYPKDGPNEDLHGKTVSFKVTLKQIKKLELPPLDDELAKDAGFESLDKMKENIGNSLKVVQNMRVRNKLREAAYDALVEQNKFEVPQSLVREQAMQILREAMARLEAEGMRYDLQRADVEQLISTYTPKAERVVRSGLILAEIAKAEKIEVTDEDVEKHIQNYAEMTKQDPNRVRAQYGDEQRQEMLRFQIADEKVLDFLLSNADIAEGEPLPQNERQLR